VKWAYLKNANSAKSKVVHLGKKRDVGYSCEMGGNILDCIAAGKNLETTKIRECLVPLRINLTYGY